MSLPDSALTAIWRAVSAVVHGLMGAQAQGSGCGRTFVAAAQQGVRTADTIPGADRAWKVRRRTFTRRHIRSLVADRALQSKPQT